MHNTFKRQVLVAVLGCLIGIGISGCRKGYDFRDASIIGYDLRLCATCCGGLFIKIDGETPQNNTSYFLISNKPSEFGIDTSTVFPVNGKVVWVANETQCLDKIDVIAWIKK
jgi:hypothetical protein